MRLLEQRNIGKGGRQRSKHRGEGEKSVKKCRLNYSEYRARTTENVLSKTDKRWRNHTFFSNQNDFREIGKYKN